jgi:AbrB family looped-hinge helix DNA binding protein
VPHARGRGTARILGARSRLRLPPHSGSVPMRGGRRTLMGRCGWRSRSMGSWGRCRLSITRRWSGRLDLPRLKECGRLAIVSRTMSTGGTARLDERGRLVLPAELRRRLGLRAGDEVRISEESPGVLRVESRAVAARGLIGSAGSPGSSVIDELHAERRQQAAAEDRDANHGVEFPGVRPPK